jgi:hypothetical protein
MSLAISRPTLRRLRAADQGEGLKRCDLLWDRTLETESGEAPAELLQGGNRGDHPPPPGLGGQGRRLRQARPGDRRDKRGIVEIGSDELL